MANPRAQRLEQLQEEERRAKERQRFKEGQELESLRRTFKRINKAGNGKISVEDLKQELSFLGFSLSDKEARQYVWEVDDENYEVAGVLHSHAADVKAVAWHPTAELPPIWSWILR